MWMNFIHVNWISHFWLGEIWVIYWPRSDWVSQFWLHAINFTKVFSFSRWRERRIRRSWWGEELPKCTPRQIQNWGRTPVQEEGKKCQSDGNEASFRPSASWRNKFRQAFTDAFGQYVWLVVHEPIKHRTNPTEIVSSYISLQRFFSHFIGLGNDPQDYCPRLSSDRPRKVQDSKEESRHWRWEVNKNLGFLKNHDDSMF